MTTVLPTESQTGLPATTDWPDVREWRREQRRRLTARRGRLDRPERELADGAILGILGQENLLKAVDTGIYWPLQGEVDSRPLMDAVLGAGGRVAIPVIVTPDVPLEFWRWDRQTRLQAQGPWGIPAPSERDLLRPSLLFIPLVGFDADGHRLGNGGGYFDRTLAALVPRPLTIGIGYELGRLDTIYPQAHDVSLDAIVTERGIRWR